MSDPQIILNVFLEGLQGKPLDQVIFEWKEYLSGIQNVSLQ